MLSTVLRRARNISEGSNHVAVQRLLTNSCLYSSSVTIQSAQPAYATDNDPNDPHSSVHESGYKRRLEELRSAQGGAQPETRNSNGTGRFSNISQPLGLPSQEEVAERLRSHKGASCSSSALPQPEPEPDDSDKPALNWRDVVEALRQETISGEQMLTDTFG